MLRQRVTQAAANPEFIHHKWFTKWHLEVVEKLAVELCEYYPAADENVVRAMAWLHDYGKILVGVGDDQYEATTEAGKQLLLEAGFAEDFAQTVVDNIATMDKKMEIDLKQSPIEVQIVATADGCSHMVGPFMHVFWHEATDETFKGHTYEQLMLANLAKAEKDWNRKIVLPEARRAFASRYQFLREQSGDLPEKFFS